MGQRRLLCLLIPQERKKKKLEGGGENSHPHFLPWFPRKDPGQGGQGEGAGRSGPIAVNRSRPPPGPLPSSLAAFPSSPRSPTPSRRSPPPQARPGREAGAALPASPASTTAAWALALGLGVGLGFPAGESSPGAGGGAGEGMEIGEWRIKVDSSSARARPARGILGKKWPRGTGRAQRGAGVRGQGPGAPRAQPPT